jgi:hypothetical protein
MESVLKAKFCAVMLTDAVVDVGVGAGVDVAVGVAVAVAVGEDVGVGVGVTVVVAVGVAVGVAVSVGVGVGVPGPGCETQPVTRRTATIIDRASNIQCVVRAIGDVYQYASI